MDRPPPFADIKTRKEAAAFLDTTWEAIRHILFRTRGAMRYTTFEIEKRGGGKRTIEAPSPQLKKLQQRLLVKISPLYTPPACVFAYTQGRNIKQNAQAHKGCRQLLTVDLKDFFPTIHIGRVVGLFRAWPFGFGNSAAELLAQLCTYQARLPQGAPTSPLISNMICYTLDRELIAIAKEKRCVYTRYADDISISTRKSTLPPDFVESVEDGKVTLGSLLIQRIAEAKFIINDKKVRIRTRAERMIVTGLKVNRFPNVQKRILSQVRAMLHAWKKFGLQAAETEFRIKYDKKSRNPNNLIPAFRFVVLGKLVFIGQIRGFHDPKFTLLAEKLYELDPTLLPKTPAYAAGQITRLATCVLTDDDEMETGSGCFVRGVGLVTCAHVAKFATRAFYPDSPNTYGNVSAVKQSLDYDLAICETNLQPRAEFEPQLGEARVPTGIFLYGFPNYNQGFKGVLASGTITGVRPAYRGHLYIVSARIVQGSSGGAVTNARGELIAIAAKGDKDQLVGYQPSDYSAIPLHYLKYCESI